MDPRFAYSLDGNQFTGSFLTRHEALAHALDEARRHPDPSGSVYVAQLVSPDPQADGHAQELIREIRRRAYNTDGDRADAYLATVSESAEADLDDLLEQAILNWLKAHNLAPSWHRVQGISEHRIPQEADMRSGGSDDVASAMGSEESPWTA